MIFKIPQQLALSADFYKDPTASQQDLTLNVFLCDRLNPQRIFPAKMLKRVGQTKIFMKLLLKFKVNPDAESFRHLINCFLIIQMSLKLEVKCPVKCLLFKA